MRNGTAEPDHTIISHLFFRLLPVQVAIVAMGSINSIVDGIVAARFIDATTVGVVGLYFTVLRFLEAAGSVLLGGVSVLAADDECTVIGADLTNAQTEEVYAMFGLERGSVRGGGLFRQGGSFGEDDLFRQRGSVHVDVLGEQFFGFFGHAAGPDQRYGQQRGQRGETGKAFFHGEPPSGLCQLYQTNPPFVFFKAKRDDFPKKNVLCFDFLRLTVHISMKSPFSTFNLQP